MSHTIGVTNCSFRAKLMLNKLFNTLLKITPHNTQKEEEQRKEQRMDLHDDIRGRSPIQFLTRPTGLNLSAATKPSFAKVMSGYVFPAVFLVEK